MAVTASLNMLAARVPHISATNKGPIVNLVAWITMVIMILSVLTVMASKWFIARKLQWTDLIITSAMILGIAHNIAVSSAVSHGLGSPLSTLSTTSYMSYQKAGYASQLLYIVTLLAAKASTLILLITITPQKSHRIPMYAVGAVTAAWAFAAFWAAAFQCSLPRPYLFTSFPPGTGPSSLPHATCFNQLVFWDVVGAFDVLTDVALMLLPILVVRGLQLARQKKINVVLAFSFRTVAIGMLIFRLVTLHGALTRGTDVTLNAWIPMLATLLEVFFSIFAACVPHLRPFMESIQAGYLSGVMNEGEGTVNGGSRRAYGDNYVMSKVSRREAERNEKSAIRNQLNSKQSIDLPRHGQRDVEARPGIGQALSTNDAVATVRSDRGHGQTERPAHVRQESVGSEGGRSGESTGSKAMIIKTTKEWSVKYQE